MGGAQEEELTGPDLTEGVPVASLEDGEMLVGHVDGEAVLLARRGKEWFAVGARCSHYGGPLAEGLLVGDSVRCPWHHAAFDLRSGEAVRPPALQGLPCWEVEVRDGRVYVTGKRAGGREETKPTRRAARSGLPESVVIVGAGAAGHAAAETLRREGYTGRITVIDGDPDASVDRPNLSKDYLAGTAPEEWLPLGGGSFYEDHEINRIPGRVAAALEPAQRRIVLDDGGIREYDALLIATGASPVRLPAEVAGGRTVHYLRTLADSRAIIAAAEGSHRAMVLGASFIGLEVAASLRARGLEVHVVAPERRPLERVMGAELGDFIRGLHEEQGVVFHLGRTAGSLTEEGAVLDDGSRVAADLVVAGIGVRPSVSLAERAGIGTEDGILVDARLETEAPGIFAAGDVARWPDPHTGARLRVEHWVVAQRMGQAAARSMLGAPGPFDAVPFFWSQHYDVTIAYVGHADEWDEVRIEGDPTERDCAVAFRREDATRALATIFRDRESLRAELEMEQRTLP